MYRFLKMTAWPMTAPTPYSAFHICFAITGVVLAALLAHFLAKWKNGTYCYRILFFCGLFLAVSEVYKQLFLYYIVNEKHYDWWYFPFQLCSLPMYFCLLLPLVHSIKCKRILCTFMQDFNLLGGFMALLIPYGFLQSYWTLTLHGFLWHIILIFIGLLIVFSRHSDRRIVGYVNTLPLFGICCLIASFINVITGPSAYTDMFYISPYYPSTQMVFHQIALTHGVLFGNIAYLLCVCLGGFLFHLLIRFDSSKS